MKLTFVIDYYTTLGQRVAIHLATTTATGVTQHTILHLHTDDQHTWYGDLFLKCTERTMLTYSYAVYEHECLLREEVTKAHEVVCCPNRADEHLIMRDVWCDTALHSAYQSTALREVVFGCETQRVEEQPKSITFKISALPLANQEIALVGSCVDLGHWQPEHAVPMTRVNAYEWSVCLPLSSALLASAYKYIWRAADGAVIWEEGENRHLLPHHKQGLPFDRLQVDDGLLRVDPPLWRGAGMVLPLFSIRTEHTCGVGDMTSLATLIRWCASLNFSVLQLLPINDTTDIGSWRESYPYNGVSVFALHPMYLDITAMGVLTGAMAEEYRLAQQQLNANTTVDYEAVNRIKWRFIRWQYDQHKAHVCTSAAYHDFCAQNEAWLPQYAYFCYFRDLYHTADFRQWPHFSTYDGEQIQSYFAQNSEASDELQLHYYIQYELHRQLMAAKQVAQEHSIILKGDIPIGICRNSDSAWACPTLFNFDGQAGAPPDDFAQDGQNWGFPTYAWEQHAATHYAWWRQRFAHLSTYFDAYRIDHVLGFFRIWEIPYGTRSGLLGQFSPALGISVQELATFGFVLDVERHLTPHVSHQALANAVGMADVTDVVATCFVATEAGEYRFKDTLNNQSALLLAFTQKTEWPDATKEYLLQLYTEVLFVRDRANPELLHPRIQGEKTLLFQQLSPEQQSAYRSLYQHYYYQRNDALWQREALQKLGALMQSSCLLPCAEDLGMLPNGVRDTLNALGLLSLEIQTMPKTPWTRFADTATYPYLSVATFATHDMPPLRLWWHSAPEAASAFWTEVLHGEGIAPQTATPEVCEQIVRQHLESPSMLCLLAFQDWLSIDAQLRAVNFEQEQINCPADPNHYWCYRMHRTIEDLEANTALTHKIRTLVQQTRPRH